jgi:hypothetical protein
MYSTMLHRTAAAATATAFCPLAALLSLAVPLALLLSDPSVIVCCRVFVSAANPPGYKYVPSVTNPTIAACGKDTYSLGMRFQTECTPCPSGFATSPTNVLGSHTSVNVCSEFLSCGTSPLIEHAELCEMGRHGRHIQSLGCAACPHICICCWCHQNLCASILFVAFAFLPVFPHDLAQRQTTNALRHNACNETFCIPSHTSAPLHLVLSCSCSPWIPHDFQHGRALRQRHLQQQLQRKLRALHAVLNVEGARHHNRGLWSGVC